MNTFVVCLCFLSAIKFGHLLHLNDEEVLSDIKFFNKSYAELRFLSFKDPMKVYLKPYLTDEKTNEQIIDKNCVFTGRVAIGKELSGTSVISICAQQTTGIIDLNGKLYSLNPYNSWNISNLGTGRTRRSLTPKVLSRIRHDPDDSVICANSLPEVNARAMPRSVGYVSGEDMPNVNFGRATIKLAVFIDRLLFENRFNRDLVEAKEFVAINVAFLQKQLQQKKILRFVDFKLVIVHFSIAPFYDTHDWDIMTYLSKFCNWVEGTTHYSQVNILLSGATLWWIVEGQLSTRIKGLANVAELCNPSSSCVLVEAKEGFKSVRVLVHEFGHNIGAHHDGKEEFNTTACNGEEFIMSWAVANGRNTWSECSAKLIRLLLLSMKHVNDESGKRVQCLKKEVKPMDKVLDITAKKYERPGFHINPDQQCRLVFGPRFSYDYKDYKKICTRMKCKDDFFVTSTWGALEGTDCGKNRTCDMDTCQLPRKGQREGRYFKEYMKLAMPNLAYVPGR